MHCYLFKCSILMQPSCLNFEIYDSMCFYKEINALLHRISYFSVKFCQNVGKWRFRWITIIITIIVTRRFVGLITVRPSNELRQNSRPGYKYKSSFWTTTDTKHQNQAVINYLRETL